MPGVLTDRRELGEIASSAESSPQRALASLHTLRRLVPYDGAWMALADPFSHRYTSLASVDLDEPMLDFLRGPQMAHDIEVTWAHRNRPPLSPSNVPCPVEELRTWADCLIRAGYREALAVPLFEPEGRHVGFMALLSRSRQSPSLATRRRLSRLAPVLARTIDPMRSLLTAARMVRGTTAGVVLRGDGGTEPLPGLVDHGLLATGSPVLAVARAGIRGQRVYSSFLWPLGGRHAPDGHVRVTALASNDGVPERLTGMVLLSPATDIHGLTPRELEVLGLLVDGCSNQEIASALVVAQRTVAAHLEHILAKLAAPTRTLAAVRAERAGLYVPVRRRAPSARL